MESAKINAKGYPRPVSDRNGQNTPLPWVGGNNPFVGVWGGIDADRSEAAGDDNLCIVCGNTLSTDWVYMVANLLDMFTNRKKPTIADYKGQNGLPAPTRVHPKCGTIAATFCPHLKNQQKPACTQNGQFLTHQQLKELSNNSPKPVNDGNPDIEPEPYEDVAEREENRNAFRNLLKILEMG